MKDYTKVCWYCKAEAMCDEGSYYKCRSCGATHSPVPEVAPEEFTEEFSEVTGGMEYRPTKSLTRRIKKQREGK
jgi:hypothetical protein